MRDVTNIKNCSVCGQPSHFGTCAQVAKMPKKAPTKATRVRHYPEGLNRHPRVKERFATGAKRTPRYLRSALDTAIERGERLAKIARIIERLSKGCQCACCRDRRVNALPFARILKLAKGA